MALQSTDANTEGAALIGLTLAACGVAALIPLTLLGASEAAVRSFVRSTAQIGVTLLCLALSASSLHALLRARVTGWAVRARRRIGLSFATAHGLHLIGLIVLAAAFPDPFVVELQAGTLIGGGLAYLFLLGMALTSSDRAWRWLGARRWTRLHTLGGYYIWLVFALTYLPLSIQQPGYLAPSALLVLTLVLRIQHGLRRRATSAAAQDSDTAPEAPVGSR